MCIAVNVARVKGQIAEACARVGRNPNEVRLLAVTKYATDEQVDRLIAAGVHTLGENRVQQAVERMERFGCHDVEWHLIGSLQTNKVKYCRNFSLIHSLDRWRLAEELEKRASQWGKRQDVLVQVNISGEDAKHGLEPNDALEFSRRLAAECPHIRTRGLMVMAPLVEAEATRPYFRQARELYEHIKYTLGLDWDILSMGMSGDFEVAIEEGATLVRIGSALFREEE
ncbi:MAG: YggS family pyridoxal phosphate-dependent enzyme [Firmicutes bacterium]|nr:YggS family pyridoxal phosphate-dependent enzyme [Bacillota bacterium]